jgi:hypothetical protein
MEEQNYPELISADKREHLMKKIVSSLLGGY